jgi:transcriptional regulator with XRE-family HTH domain
MTINRVIATTRRAAGISQGRLARRAGMSQTLLSQFEIGNIALRPEQITRLENALRDELVGSFGQISKFIDQGLASAAS